MLLFMYISTETHRIMLHVFYEYIYKESEKHTHSKLLTVVTSEEGIKIGTEVKENLCLMF